MEGSHLLPNLFRTEYSRIVSVLCARYGLTNIDLAEDFVSDSFLKAAETWKLRGIPENPKAWLYTVAKNNAKDFFKRRDVFDRRVISKIYTGKQDVHEFDIDLSEHNIKDSQLQMIFAICDPVNSIESQIALALKILCGFGIGEIASALLTSKQNINKRLFRAKEKLRSSETPISMPSKMEMGSRLDSVLAVLYLLFNEGYYSSTTSYTIRKDLCFEAVRLLYILTENSETSRPRSNALMALFCFHSSRFDARTNGLGEHVLYDAQDKDKWNLDLIAKGESYLDKSRIEGSITKYHLEALIAFWHTRVKLDPVAKWDNILHLYNRLLQIEYSPITALNRTFALSKVKGKEYALKEALKIELDNNYYYHSLVAELYAGTDREKEIEHLSLALELTDNDKDKQLLMRKLVSIR